MELHESDEYTGKDWDGEETVEGALAHDEIAYDAMKEGEPEPSEEDIALKSLDKEHMDDYMAIRRAVRQTDLPERLVALAVANGLLTRHA